MFVLLTLLLLGLGAIAVGASNASQGAIPPPSKTIAGYDFTLAGVDDPAASVPLVVVLHADDSTPDEALAAVAGLEGARVLAPAGKYATKAGRHAFVAPDLQGEPYWKALRDESLHLQEFVAAALARFPTRHRAIVVGLGSQGTAAVQLGLGATPIVRQAYAAGGVFQADWVPLATVYSGTVRQLAWGSSLPWDQQAAAVAVTRGFDYTVEAGTEPPTSSPDSQVVNAWILPQIVPALDKP